MGDVQQQSQQHTSENDEPEKKRRIACDFPGKIFLLLKSEGISDLLLCRL
jgi:hypothetical protein